ncbi:hypothetical protein DRN58_06555 [Thermococci archaeon]|nr:MAG: hypothetical protein DRN58_06555 [Thermococci archaeon]
MKIAWVSRHDPLPAQVKELKRLFGENVVIVQYKRTFRDAKEIIEELKKFDLKIAVVVAPLSMIAHLIKEKSILWLWADMKPANSEFDEKTDVIYGSRHLRFNKFYKIKEVKIEFEEVGK